MKILMLLGRSTGGIAGHVAALSLELRKGGADVVVVTDPRTAGRFDAQLVRASWPGSTGLVRSPRDLRTLRRLASASDVVHAHGLRAGALGALVVGSLQQHRRPRLVVTLHNAPVGGLAVRTVSAGLERLVARGADVVLGVSGDLVERARSLGARRTERALVPAPTMAATQRTVDEVRTSLGVPAEAALLVTVARLAPQKGLDTLCATALLLKDRLAAGDLPEVTGLTWVVAGDGPLRDYLEGRIETDGLPVLALGRRDDVPELLAAADLVVSTAVWEGQPIWLQEAMALGAPIVATDVGGTSEVTGDGASLVPAGDAVGLSGRIVDLIGDSTRRQSLRSAALERAQQLPTMADVVGQLMDLYTG
ncbi:MAG: glycosyltransferase family 4 protein [Actinomycetota bacterium]